MISVIVPVYNAGKYLVKCLDSIVEQSYTDLEILLVDDGSSDNSGKICDLYAHKDGRVKVFHQENRGLSAARNRGLSRANGDYITFVDSDDYIELDTYEEVYKSIVSYDPDIVFFREKSVNLKGETIYINGDTPTGKVHIGNRKDALDLVIPRLINGVCDKVFRKELLCGLSFQEGFMYGEDYWFNLHALRNVERMVYIDQIKYSYVSNNDSVTHKKFNRNSFDQIYFKDRIKEFISDNYPEYSQYGFKQAFLARLRIMRLLYGEHLDSSFTKDIESIKQEMRCQYPDCKLDLSMREKIEYYLFMNTKLLYRIFLVITKWFKK